MKKDKPSDIWFSNDKSWLIKELKTSRAKRMLKALATMHVKGEIDYKILGNIYRPTEKIPEASVKRLLRHKETQIMVDQEIEKILIGNGVTKDFIIKEELSVLSEIKKDKKINPRDMYTIRLDITDGFKDLYGLKGKNKQITTTEQVDYTQYLENNEKQSISAKRTVETPILESEKKEEKEPKTDGSDTKK